MKQKYPFLRAPLGVKETPGERIVALLLIPVFGIIVGTIIGVILIAFGLS